MGKWINVLIKVGGKEEILAFNSQPVANPLGAIQSQK